MYTKSCGDKLSMFHIIDGSISPKATKQNVSLGSHIDTRIDERIVEHAMPSPRLLIVDAIKWMSLIQRIACPSNLLIRIEQNLRAEPAERRRTMLS